MEKHGGERWRPAASTICTESWPRATGYGRRWTRGTSSSPSSREIHLRPAIRYAREQARRAPLRRDLSRGLRTTPLPAGRLNARGTQQIRPRDTRRGADRGYSYGLCPPGRVRSRSNRPARQASRREAPAPPRAGRHNQVSWEAQSCDHVPLSYGAQAEPPPHRPGRVSGQRPEQPRRRDRGNPQWQAQQCRQRQAHRAVKPDP